MSATARPLGLRELPLLALAGRGPYSNHAVTLEHGAQSAQHRPSVGRLLKSCLKPGGRQIWLSRDGLSLLGLAAVRPRAGGSAWEIDSLILGLRSEAFVLDLLERCIATAGAHGAHRLFLRLPAGSPILPAAQRQGFASVCEEILLTAPVPSRDDRRDAAPPGSIGGWRRRRRRDDHDLFRLFSATVPREVRWQTALAPREWRAGQDPLGRGAQEWVWDGNGGGVQALARIGRSDHTIRASLLADDRPQPAQAAVALLHALSTSKGRSRRTHVLLPDYLPVLASTLRDNGFQDTARYELGVRPIAQRTQRLQLAERPLEGTARPVIQ